ncbi:conserved Plasmodium protein, unknown function [Plasmodium sp. gorilla clade G3]|nr:conserved Plasmodium protein, unknown function [Plasmodium sp. gorilla clade G3]
MSGAAIGVENRCLMKNKNSNNNTCENVNVDINYIIKDIYGYKNCKKRCIQFIEDDTIGNDDIDLRKMKNKKIKVENMWYQRCDSNDMNNNNNNDNNNDNDNNDNHHHHHHNNNNNNDVDDNTFKRYNNYNEKHEENDNMEKEVYHTCTIPSRERSSVNGYSNNNNYYYINYQMNNENIKNSNNINMDKNENINMCSNNLDNNDDINSIDINDDSNNVDSNDDSNNVDSNDDSNNVDSNDDSNNVDSNNDRNNIDNKDNRNNKYNHDNNHNYYHKKRNKPILCLNEPEDKYLLSKKTESLIDTILFNIHSCSKIEQAKKIMLPLLNDFIQNNFYKYINFYEDNQNSSKHNVQTLQKEKKVLISAVKIQYQKILQLQKLIENQKSDIKKKTEELNQIKAKVHQYFYDINNPNKRIFSILSPDVY